MRVSKCTQRCNFRFHLIKGADGAGYHPVILDKRAGHLIFEMGIQIDSGTFVHPHIS